jgi:hypothetical protein
MAQHAPTVLARGNGLALVVGPVPEFGIGPGFSRRSSNQIADAAALGIVDYQRDEAISGQGIAEFQLPV